MRNRTSVLHSKMKSRCDNPNINRWEFYGGRGIAYDPSWAKFDNFLSYMGECPDGYQLDRINNNGNYEPGNCRWVLPRDNIRNRSISRLSVRKVQLIKALYRAKDARCSVLKMANIIAPMFDVKSDTIRKVKSGRIWSEIQ